ncbi:MAG: D-alanine--D-alanine ligase [Puniceicoccales bacterium]|nr:D-alanine--D-alanine ligase [Puniceicoccales bacterium]
MSTTPPSIAVLCGAVSPEREVSLRSGKACANALLELFPDLSFHVLDENALPAFLDPAREIVFPVIHGDYGEDGGVQHDLESRGFAYVGCDEAASRVCMNKVATKEKLHATGVPVAPGAAFSAAEKPDAAALARALASEDIVLKPADKGSSVGLRFARGAADIKAALAEITAGNWMAEPRITGREMTIGLLDGAPMGIVEIVPRAGHYDYTNKYTAGATEYLFPAAVPAAIAATIGESAARAFAACGCRDFARADFILREDGSFIFLEINTMPGLTATSLLPKSASCIGLDFPALCGRMLAPALRRFKERRL